MRAFAQRVARRLPASYKPLFGSAEEVPQVLLDQGNFCSLLPVTAPAFLHQLLKVCLDRQVAAILPLGIEELYPIAEARSLFSEYGVEVWLPDAATLASIPIIENPPKQLRLKLTEEGVFTPSDSGNELALCCVSE